MTQRRTHGFTVNPFSTSKKSNQTVQRTGASRFVQRQIQHHGRLVPVADLFVRPLDRLATMNAALKFILVAWLMVSSVAAVIGWIAFAKARDENKTLAARLQLVNLEEETKPSSNQTESGEISKLR